MVDRMLKQLGVEHRRKLDQGRVAEFMEPYTPADYRGLAEEWLRGKRGGEGERK
jgi:hypothetical protein